jgi:phosphoserine phosphatase
VGWIVFDFDKTLTSHDTLFGFYKAVHGDGIRFRIKHLGLLLAAILYKSRLISNDQLKKVGVFLFLKNKSEKTINQAGQDYASKIALNEIYQQQFLKTPKDQRLIISAAFEEYLKKLFPDENVVGSKLYYKNGEVVGLSRNMYGKAKVDYLFKEGLRPIQEFYTDNNSDRPLINRSEKVWLVKNGEKFPLF